MADLPFMQLYVADYLKDTLLLSCEEHGAYMLLLMTLWAEGGQLPDEDEALARATRLTPARWRAVRKRLAPFFIIEGGVLTHKRVTAELERARQKSGKRAEAGALGGKASALKRSSNEQAIAEANATANAQASSPDSRVQKEQSRAGAGGAQEDVGKTLELCLVALGLNGFDDAHKRKPGLLQIGPILSLVSRGYTLSEDILPVLRDHATARKAPPGNWAYFVDAIVERAAKRASIPQRPAPAAVDWGARVAAWRADKTWSSGWGPAPGEAGCRVPPELVEGVH